MTHVLMALILVFVTVGWFLLALVPALREHYGRSDVGPLRVASAAADIRYFAISFQNFVNVRLDALRAGSDATVPRVTTLPDGSGVWYASKATGQSHPVTVFEGADEAAIAQGLVVISEASVRVASGVQVLKELYTSRSLEGEMGCVYRAILVGGDAILGPGSEVLRWVNTGGALAVGSGSTLWGRASSWGVMAIGEGTQFQRLAAPRIEFGWPQVVREPDTRVRTAMTPPNHVSVFASRWVVDGDLHIPDSESVDADLIVSGRLTVGRGARLGGAVRCDVLVSADDAVFARSVVATTALSCGSQCDVAGPVVVEGEAVFGDRCRVGDRARETTISASSVRIGNGAVMHGEIWARRQGVVAAIPLNTALAPAA